VSVYDAAGLRGTNLYFLKIIAVRLALSAHIVLDSIVKWFIRSFSGSLASVSVCGSP
jgi:hypothetical protein